MLRAASELDADATIVSLDGRSDTVSRAAFLTKLREVAPALVRYVRAWYGGTSTYLWWDAEGRRPEMSQGDGCEQAPALYTPWRNTTPWLRHKGDWSRGISSPALDDVTRTVERHAGVAANLGKTRVYRASGGPPPPNVEALGPDVWCGGDSEPASCGFVALGVPIGHTEFMRRSLAARLEEERPLLQELPELPDMQGAWHSVAAPALLRQPARPICFARSAADGLGAAYAAEHDQAVWTTAQHLLAEQDTRGREWHAARQIAFLPAASGGLGLANAERLAPAADWAAWADALPVMLQRCPEVARRKVERAPVGLMAGKSWQLARVLNTSYRERARVPASTLGVGPLRWTWRARLPSLVDQLGDHRAVCARSGLLARLAPIFERAWVRVAREAVTAEGRVVSQQWLARTTAPGVAPDDRRRLDLVIYGASRRGEALCCDVTLVSPLRADGRPQPASSERDGAAIDVANGATLNWPAWAHDLVRSLTQQRSLRAPRALRAAARAGWERLWWGQLGCALQRALASTLLGGCWRALFGARRGGATLHEATLGCA
ncbi:CPY1 [Symbiodinium sp. KB8]|nr:CPY1 [Symbiodinium sp. KB8]